MASSFFTLCFALACWTLTASTSPDQNLIDYWVFWFLSKLRLFKRTRRVRHFWVPVIEKVMLSLSDQQLLTGLSVLIAGFATHCSISAYHFAIVSDLAWFSSNVHLSTLTVLEGYLLKKRGVRNWRVVSIMCMGILLIANNAMQGHWAWSESWSFDAQCLFDNLIGNWGARPGYWAEVNIALLVVFYPMQILLLFDTTSELIDKWLWVRPSKRIEALRPSSELVSSSRSNSMKLRYQGQRFIHTIAHVIYISVAALLGSRTVSYALDLFWFAYGVWSLKSDRSAAGKQMDGSENLLTFGQMIPLLLLSSTVFVFKETYEGENPEFETPQSAANACNRKEGPNRRREDGGRRDRPFTWLWLPAGPHPKSTFDQHSFDFGSCRTDYDGRSSR